MRWGNRRSRYGIRLLSAASIGAGLCGLVWTAAISGGPGLDTADRASVFGFGVSALGLVVGMVSLWVSWQGYLADRREHVEGLPLTEIVDEFAVAVRIQWEAEAQVRRLNDPYPLPLSWHAADQELVEPWNLLLRQAAGDLRDAAALPHRWASSLAELEGAGGEIVTVFADRAPGSRLVILGEPGSGKSMLLVRLLLGLMERRAPGGAVPVIFPLASWDPARKDLDAWMAERLATDHPGLAFPAPTRHGAVTSRARALLDHRLVLPLLDGFDELPERLRGMALDAINRTLPSGRALVLSSRTTEYRSAVTPRSGIPVRLTGAVGIELQALDASEARAYLCRDAGGVGTSSARRWSPVLARLGGPTPAGLALRTPLMLFLARTVYNPRPGEGIDALPDPADLCDDVRFPTATDLRAHLFDAFVPAAYRPHPRHPSRWNPRQAERALSFLARHLESDGGGSVDLAVWRLRRAVPSYAMVVLAGTAVGLCLLVLSLVGFGSLPWRHDAWFAPLVYLCLPFFLAVSLLTGGDGGDLSAGWGDLIAEALLIHILIGIGLVAALELRAHTEPARRMRWRWSPRTGAGGLLVGAALGIPLTLVFGITGGLGWGLVAMILVWTIDGWTTVPVDLTTAVNPDDLLAADRKAFRSFITAGAALGSLVLGLGLGLVLACVEAQTSPDAWGATLPESLLDSAAEGIGLGLWCGAGLGLTAAFTRTAWGAFTLTRHYLALRYRLPRDLMGFLTDAHAQRGVLRQVGAVHQFRHIELQRRLAATDNTRSSP